MCISTYHELYPNGEKKNPQKLNWWSGLLAKHVPHKVWSLDPQNPHKYQECGDEISRTTAETGYPQIKLIVRPVLSVSSRLDWEPAPQWTRSKKDQGWLNINPGPACAYVCVCVQIHVCTHMMLANMHTFTHMHPTHRLTHTYTHTHTKKKWEEKKHYKLEMLLKHLTYIKPRVSPA